MANHSQKIIALVLATVMSGGSVFSMDIADCCISGTGPCCCEPTSAPAEAASIEDSCCAPGDSAPQSIQSTSTDDPPVDHSTPTPSCASCGVVVCAKIFLKFTEPLTTENPVCCGHIMAPSSEIPLDVFAQGILRPPIATPTY